MSRQMIFGTLPTNCFPNIYDSGTMVEIFLVRLKIEFTNKKFINIKNTKS